MRQRVTMRLVEMKTGGSPGLVPEGPVDWEKVRVPNLNPLEPPDPPSLEEVEEITHIEQLIGGPVPDHRDKNLPTAVSARIQRIIDRCSDGLGPATPDH